jgi:hypothetical protein
MAIESIREAVGAAIERASQATGVDFGFLMRTARRESGYNPGAQAQGSSAAGLFQFVEQTWLGALKKHGAKHGYSAFADLIQTSGDGRLAVAGGDARKAVMALRMDPKASSLMAGELASDNAAYLRGRVGREPTSGELYAAHFLGPKGSADLIEARQSRPLAAAAALFPDAAAANPSIFYRDGRPASVADIYANLTQGQAGAAETAKAPASFLHYDTTARLARQEQERQITDMLLGIGQDASGQGLGQSQGGRGSAASLTGSLFSSEMLSLLSEARQSGRKS